MLNVEKFIRISAGRWMSVDIGKARCRDNWIGFTGLIVVVSCCKVAAAAAGCSMVVPGFVLMVLACSNSFRST